MFYIITTIIGLISLITPFILVDLFPNKKKGFIYVLFFWLLFQTILALATQAFGIFYYWVEIACTLFADVAVIFYYWGIKKKITFGFNIKKIDWVLVIVITISVLCLLQVHYNYTGKVSLATDELGSYQQVKNMVYPYPYLSDEWYAVSLIGGAIENHFLPVINVLNNKLFADLELFFHSFIAQIIVVLNLNPLLQYTILLAVFNSLTILLVYLFLRISGVSKLSSAISSLSTLYIVSGANLPGFWHLIPFNLGLLFFLISLCFMEFANAKIVFLSIILACLFYPPLFPFYFLALILFFFTKVKLSKEIFIKIIKWVVAIIAILLALYFLALNILPESVAHVISINHLLSRIFFVSLLFPVVSQINFYNVIPLPALLLAIFGLYYLYKNKKWTLISELILGVIFWIFYALSNYRFFIGYERVVIFVSLIVVIISGFGLFKIEECIKNKFKIIGVIIMLGFVFLIPFYTTGEGWIKIISTDSINEAIDLPRAPANNNLTEEDLRIFENIKNEVFLSLPWKGAVIGITTSNYPVLTKGGTISIGPRDLLSKFESANCQEKTSMAKKLNLDYIYLYEFDCQGFIKVDESNEGLVLYKTNLN